MKKSIWKYFLVGLVMLASACDVTDLEKVDAISEDLAFATAANVELSMVGLYDAAQSGFYEASETNDRGYLFGAAHIQQGDMRGEDFVLINVFFDFTYRATYTTVTANNKNYWENAFRIINQANLVIEGVQGAEEKGIISAAESAAYQGEARLLRAITYHTLLIHFARPYTDDPGLPGMPIYAKGINNSAEVDEMLEIGRSTVGQTYDFILDDLDYAEANLPVTRPDQKQVTRATKVAAIALKTRVYAHMGDWDAVITEGNKIVSANAPFTSPIGTYQLGASVETPWANNRSTESIFSMEMASTDNLNTNAALARMLGSTDAATGARGEYAISPIIWNRSDIWHADDLRRTLLVRSNGTRKFTHKYRDYTTWTDYAPIIRYAEVLLTLAEAEARENGLSARALALLNAVRDRAKAGAMTSYVIGDFANGTDLVQSILDERRIELLGEGHRWSDIHRLATDPNFSTGGIPAKMNAPDVTAASYTLGSTPTTGIAAIPYDNFRFLWPIPQVETVRNPKLAEQQNPGY